MALNYADRAALLPNLSPRVSEAIRKYLLYLSGGGGGASAERIGWANTNMKQIPALTAEILPWLASETAFIDGGTSISDQDITARVENVMNAEYLPA